MRRAIHEFNILQRRIARGVYLPQYAVPPSVPSPAHGLVPRQSQWLYSALGTPEENHTLGTTADEALLSRRQPHRNFDSSTLLESPPTPATPAPATPPPTITPTPTRSRSRTPPPSTGLLYIHPLDSLLSWLDNLHLSSALDRSHQHPLDGRGILRGHLWQATRFRPTTPLPNPLIINEGLSPPPPETTL